MKIAMNKKFIWFVLLLLIIAGVVFFFLKRPKEESEIDDNEEKIEEEVEEKDEEGEEKEEEEYEYTGSTDFSSFSTDTQSVGELSDAQFSIEKLEETTKDGYHEFVFTLQSDQEEEPFATASYISSMGVIRLDFQSISRDSTGIGYQQEKIIDKEGVTRIYHNVSAQADQELYDIGITKSTPFKLSSEEKEEGNWSITLQVKYPGERTTEVNLGLEEFTSFDQEIPGIGAKENASIISYTYGRPSGLLKLVWSVSGDGESPIPNVKAFYNEKDELVVTFESLVIDRVANLAETMMLPSSITATVERTGETSTYVLSGIGSKREYRLSASLSPNQVILEIK